MLARIHATTTPVCALFATPSTTACRTRIGIGGVAGARRLRRAAVRVTADRAALRKLLARATRGRWTWIPTDKQHGPGFRFGAEGATDEAGYAYGEQDTELLVEAVNALPALLDAVDEAEKALRKVPLPQTSDPEVFWHAYEAAREALAQMGEKA